MLNPFKYVNLPIFFLSWLGFMGLSFLLLPRVPVGSTGYYVGLCGVIICFLFFMWQCVRGFMKLAKDATRGAQKPGGKD